jgi:hypothetical protein
VGGRETPAFVDPREVSGMTASLAPGDPRLPPRDRSAPRGPSNTSQRACAPRCCAAGSSARSPSVDTPVCLLLRASLSGRS